MFSPGIYLHKNLRRDMQYHHTYQQKIKKTFAIFQQFPFLKYMGMCVLYSKLLLHALNLLLTLLESGRKMFDANKMVKPGKNCVLDLAFPSVECKSSVTHTHSQWFIRGLLRMRFSAFNYAWNFNFSTFFEDRFGASVLTMDLNWDQQPCTTR